VVELAIDSRGAVAQVERIHLLGEPARRSSWPSQRAGRCSC
jgi:hypothetical protein